MHLGLGRFESVSILGFNSPEWHLSNMGAIAAGGFAAGIYTTNEPDACKYILKHSNARIVVVDGQKQLDKILKIRGDLPKLVAIVVWARNSPRASTTASARARRRRTAGTSSSASAPPSRTPRSRRASRTRSPATAPRSSTPPAPPATPRRS